MRNFINIKTIKSNWYKIALALIMALAGFLTFYAIGQEGYANQYYSAAVKSMLTSCHNFFFASFDAGGYVTVDKPALGLWLQAISALIFGFHGWSLILPEALSTVISVALIYHLVQRSFGKTAGVLSSLILALTPILIAVSRTNNLDASLVMVLLLATWAMIVAAERGSLKHLILSVVLIGVGFNIKMLEAFMILPALYLVYIFTSPLKIRKRILHLTVSTIVLFAVSLSWAVAVDLTPTTSRPYIGSSQTNSVIELALGYNGIQRITGSQGNRGVMQPQDGQNQSDSNSQSTTANTSTVSNASSLNTTSTATNKSNTTNKNNQSITDNQIDGNRGNMPAPPDDGNFKDGGQRPSDGNMPGGFDDGRNRAGLGDGGGNGGPGGTGENGQKGIFRIFNQQLSGQISWFLIMAVFGIAMLYIKFKKHIDDNKSVLRQLILWSVWIISMLGYFSVAGFFHRYYLSMLAPGIAALAGIGIVEMWKAYMERGRKWIILPSAIVLTAAVQAKILWNYTEWRGVLIPVVCGLAGLSAVGLVIIRILKKDDLAKTIKITLAIGIAALFIAPAIWAYTPIMYGSQTTLPIAGPELKQEGTSIRQNQSSRTASSQLVKFLLSKKQNEKYLVAVADANSAAPIILETGEAVMAVGGFSGSDNILTLEKLEQMVKNGELRYFQISGRGMGQQSDIITWVKEHGKVVNYSNETTSVSTTDSTTDSQDKQNQFRGGMDNEGTLYDLAPEKG